MAGEKFKIKFVTNNRGDIEISEPEGFSDIPFIFKQDSGRYGRDFFYGGEDGENSFIFNRTQSHQFDLLVSDFEKTGFETENKLIIEKDGISNIIGDLDYQYATTDQLETFECNVIQDTNQAVLKRNDELDVNMFSNRRLDGEYIDPLVSENILVKSKPIIQKSAWETPSLFHRTYNAISTSRNQSVRNVFGINPSVDLVKSDIQSSLTFLESNQDFIPEFYLFKIIESENNLSNLKISVTNLNVEADVFKTVGSLAEGYLELSLILKYGSDFDTSITEILFTDRTYLDDPIYTNNSDYDFTIPYLSRQDSVWIYIEGSLVLSESREQKISASVDISSMNIDVSASSTAYNTIVPSLRLNDVVKQTVKSISNLDTSFPFAEQGGEMYSQRLFSGNMLRNLKNRAFNVSLDDINKWLPEINGDYQIQNDGTVLFAKYAEFYKNDEVGVFEGIRFDTYKKYLNERYAINQFSFGYEKYQSQKEEETENTFDIVHGVSQWNVQNRFVENKKEIEINFVRCSFYLDAERRKALIISEETSTQDDDTIFILDTKESESDLEFTETDFLQHTYDQDTEILKLTNDGSFSWILIGMAVGDPFSIYNDQNEGNYILTEVTERYITFSAPLVRDDNDGERTTTFKYVVTTTTAPFVSWSDENFGYIDDAVDSSNFANLKYTIKRNILRFYDEYLATCNYFAKKPIKNTSYSKNGDLAMSYDGLQSIEDAEFTPSNQILTPYMHDITVICDFNTFINLQNRLKEEKGYVRVVDANRHIIKIYPKEMTFTSTGEQGELNIIGEEKYIDNRIDIAYEFRDQITLGGQYQVRKVIYKNIGEKITIFDETDTLLFNPIIWSEISVNGAVASSKEELIGWLTIIS